MIIIRKQGSNSSESRVVMDFGDYAILTLTQQESQADAVTSSSEPYMTSYASPLF